MHTGKRGEDMPVCKIDATVAYEVDGSPNLIEMMSSWYGVARFHLCLSIFF